MPEGHDGERDDGVRHAEECADAVDPLGDGMDAEPDGPQAEQLGFDEQVLGGRGAVLFPHLRPLAPRGVAADDDRDRRLRQHPYSRMHLGDRRQCGAVAHDDEPPRLLVAGRGRRHCGAQEPFHDVVRDRLARVLADAAPAEHRVVHGHLVSRRRPAYLPPAGDANGPAGRGRSYFASIVSAKRAALWLADSHGRKYAPVTVSTPGFSTSMSQVCTPPAPTIAGDGDGEKLGPKNVPITSLSPALSFRSHW